MALCLGVGCEDLLEVEDISGQTVTLLAPSDSVTVAQSNVRFTWEEVWAADSYHVQVATPNFANAAQVPVDTLIVLDSLYQGPQFEKKLGNSTYQWRVKALNSGYETTFSTNFFVVDTTGN